jgi:hypothetical protein
LSESKDRDKHIEYTSKLSTSNITRCLPSIHRSYGGALIFLQYQSSVMARKKAKGKAAGDQHRPETKEERKIRLEKQQEAREVKTRIRDLAVFSIH